MQDRGSDEEEQGQCWDWVRKLREVIVDNRGGQHLDTKLINETEIREVKKGLGRATPTDSDLMSHLKSSKSLAVMSRAINL